MFFDEVGTFLIVIQTMFPPRVQILYCGDVVDKDFLQVIFRRDRLMDYLCYAHSLISRGRAFDRLDSLPPVLILGTGPSAELDC